MEYIRREAALAKSFKVNENQFVSVSIINKAYLLSRLNIVEQTAEKVSNKGLQNEQFSTGHFR